MNKAVADMPNDFWSGWIIALTVVSLVTLAWAVISIYFQKGKNDVTNTDEPVWDENLKEGSTAPPLWWFWLIFSSMILSVVYLILYPGLGSYKGMLNWSQDSRLKGSYEVYQEKFAKTREDIANHSIDEIKNNAVLMKSAENIFARNCAACHGYGGTGQTKLFPNLKDNDWIWGGDSEQIEKSILLGRYGVMPGFKSELDNNEMASLADYVMSLNTPNPDHPGKQKYDQICAVCHGAQGKGNQALGAPNLSDNIWLYGKDKKAIVQTISDGRIAIMPGFSGRLDKTQIKLLVAWLSN